MIPGVGRVRSLRGGLGVLWLLVLLAGCSRTGLLYNNADWFAERWASDLMDASDTQEDAWRGLFSQAMDEHRRALLPELVGLLGALETVAAYPTAEELDCWSEAAERLYRRHAQWAVPTAVAVLRDLSPAQVDHLAAELARRNEEYRTDYLDEDPTRRERERIDRYVERIERWTGELTTEQLRLVERATLAMPDLAGEWLDYRRQQQDRLLALLRAGAGDAALGRFLTAWWVEFADRPAGMVRETMQLRRDWLDLIVALHATLDPEQRTTLIENLADLRAGLARVPEGERGLRTARSDLSPCALAAVRID